MKWDVYKRMNNSQRMFWHYHFETEIPQISIIYIILLWLSMTLCISLAFIFKKSFIPDTGVQFLTFVNIASQITQWILIVWILEYIVNWVAWFVIQYKENKWLKEERLK